MSANDNQTAFHHPDRGRRGPDPRLSPDFLQDKGFKVLEAGTADDAVEIIEKRTRPSIWYSAT